MTRKRRRIITGPPQPPQKSLLFTSKPASPTRSSGRAWNSRSRRGSSSTASSAAGRPGKKEFPFTPNPGSRRLNPGSRIVGSKIFRRSTKSLNRGLHPGRKCRGKHLTVDKPPDKKSGHDVDHIVLLDQHHRDSHQKGKRV